jgi:hypothetical protein
MVQFFAPHNGHQHHVVLEWICGMAEWENGRLEEWQDGMVE